ncbi:MAG TPA: hypothetical protein VFK66_07920 [Oryzihumus sp.]|nr:hypothetical protein [Oryzihumus sp.]
MSLSAALTGASVAIAGAADAATCQGGYPASQCTVAVSDTTVTPGEKVSFSAKGFGSKELVTGVVRSTPQVVGSWRSSGGGVVSGSFRVPTNLEPGTHTFTLTGSTSGVSKSTSFTVVSSAGAGTTSGTSATSGTGSLAFTGADVAGTVGAGLVLLVGGGALVVASQRRKSAGSAA